MEEHAPLPTLWILNPEGTFPLTVYGRGVDAQVVERLRTTLDDACESGNARDADQAILPLIYATGMRCNEIDEYIAAFRPRFLKAVRKIARDNDVKCPSGEDPSDYADLVAEFGDEAAEILPVRPYNVDVAVILTAKPGEYSSDAARLIAHTYVMSRFAARQRDNADDPAIKEMLWGWEVAAVGDLYTCPCCARKDRRRRPISRTEHPPFHIGCRCTLLEVFRDEMGGNRM